MAVSPDRYNVEGSLVYKDANEMEKLFHRHYEKLILSLVCFSRLFLSPSPLILSAKLADSDKCGL